MRQSSYKDANKRQGIYNSKVECSLKKTYCRPVNFLEKFGLSIVNQGTDYEILQTSVAITKELHCTVIFMLNCTCTCTCTSFVF